MIMKEIFEFQLQQFVVDMQHTTFLLAVSGGVDSMVLLDLFQKLGLKFLQIFVYTIACLSYFTIYKIPWEF